jgi:hypothetical protein
MGKVIFMPAVPSFGAPTDAFARKTGEPGPDLARWAPERLWLSRTWLHQTAQTAMADVVADALETALAAGALDADRCGLLESLRQRRRHAAALRLTARLLRGPRLEASPVGRDLAACALLLAAVRHNDLLAAVEFAAEVSGRALTVDMERDDRPLPPGILSVGQLAIRMRSQGRDVLSHRVSWPDMDTIGPCLAKAMENDLLAPGRADPAASP